MDIQRAYTGTVWEDEVGFCRVLRAGEMVWSAGTVAADEHGEIQGEDCYAQCCYIFDKLGRALSQVGAELSQVIRVCCYLVNLDDAEGFTRAHKRYFGDVRPVCCCVIISGLFGGALAEIEVQALVR